MAAPVKTMDSPDAIIVPAGIVTPSAMVLLSSSQAWPPISTVVAPVLVSSQKSEIPSDWISVRRSCAFVAAIAAKPTDRTSGNVLVVIGESGKASGTPLSSGKPVSRLSVSIWTQHFPPLKLKGSPSLLPGNSWRGGRWAALAAANLGGRGEVVDCSRTSDDGDKDQQGEEEAQEGFHGAKVAVKDGAGELEISVRLSGGQCKGRGIH